eukprot:COSAG01_NODE_22602_length_848_cov_152.646195_2_plen_40_part_01
MVCAVCAEGVNERDHMEQQHFIVLVTSLAQLAASPPPRSF